MKRRYILYRRKRGGMFYIEDTETRKQESTGTRNRAEATSLLNARNESIRQPHLNLQIAKAYLAGTDSGVATRTWQDALNYIVESKHGPTQDRWRRAAKETALDLIRHRVIIETHAENPANYAQRSGRAGRSGQPALVFTFCGSQSNHDRHYFNNQPDLVAGQVVPPRLDLLNEELLRTHLHAIFLSEIGLPGLKDSVPDLLDLNQSALPLRGDVAGALNLSPAEAARVRNAFERAIADFRHRLTGESVAWFSNGWIDAELGCLKERLDESLERWRILYRSAQAQLTTASQKINSGLYPASSLEFKDAQLEQRLAQRQLAEKDEQHLVLLTATPHSGKPDEFQSLLGLIHRDFAALDLPSATPEQRKRLARHFLQRRRGDVLKWMGEDTPFAKREAGEISYELGPSYSVFFDQVLDFARKIVAAQSGPEREQRVHYWTALGLLRGIMSSPAAGVEMLRNRLEAPSIGAEGGTAQMPEGAPDNIVHVVTENARTLKFTAQSFEKE